MAWEEVKVKTMLLTWFQREKQLKGLLIKSILETINRLTEVSTENKILSRALQLLLLWLNRKWWARLACLFITTICLSNRTKEPTWFLLKRTSPRVGPKVIPYRRLDQENLDYVPNKSIALQMSMIKFLDPPQARKLLQVGKLKTHKTQRRC